MLPGGLAALSVTFEQLLAEADDAVQARRDGRDSRPRVRVRRVLRDRLQRETFQSADDVSRALGMAGKSGQWDAIAAAMSGSARGDSKALRALLNEFVRRRNGIVHEGDYERLERPRTAKLVPLGRAAADDAVEFFSGPHRRHPSPHVRPTDRTTDRTAAERGGFEPPRPLRACRFSRPVHSTALPPLRDGLTQRIHRSLKPGADRRPANGRVPPLH